MELTSEIYDSIVRLAKPGADPLKLSTDTNGILGLAWLVSAEKLHGALPLPTSPAALAWWTAVVLPLDTNQRYTLVRIFCLADRLELLRNWLQQMQLQWVRCRTLAIDTITQTFRSVA